MKLSKRHEHFAHPWGSTVSFWIVEGSRGAVHFHVTNHATASDASMHLRAVEASGGIEYHSRTVPAYRDGDAPDHPECRILKCPCWHHGTSLGAEGYVEHWKLAPHDHEGFWNMLAHAYRLHFHPEPEASGEGS